MMERKAISQAANWLNEKLIIQKDSQLKRKRNTRNRK